MKFSKHLLSSTLFIALSASSAGAADWQSKLSSAAEQLGGQSSSAQSGGMSLSSLTSLLNGGSQSLASGSMTNAAGILEYCIKNKLVSATNPENIKNQVLDKLGLNSGTSSTTATESESYKDGLLGLLTGNNGKQIDLNNLGSSQLAEKVKTKACDVVLEQSSKFVM